MTKIDRNSNDICLLCNKDKANKTNSHIVPAPLLKNVIGERDKEHVFAIGKNIDEYYGRDYPQTYTTEVKKSNFTYDYILCNECESYFSNLESIVIPILKNIDKESNKISKKEYNDINYTEISYNPFIIKLFYYSIIWRLIISDYIEQGTFAPNIVETEKELRKILLKFNTKSIKELRKINFEDRFLFQIITTKQEYYPFSQLFNSYSDNPFIFIAGRFIIYLFDTEQSATEKNKKFFKKENLLLNYNNKKIKIMYLSVESYNQIVKEVSKIILDNYNPKEIISLQKEMNKTIKRFNQ